MNDLVYLHGNIMHHPDFDITVTEDIAFLIDTDIGFFGGEIHLQVTTIYIIR